MSLDLMETLHPARGEKEDFHEPLREPLKSIMSSKVDFEVLSEVSSNPQNRLFKLMVEKRIFMSPFESLSNPSRARISILSSSQRSHSILKIHQELEGRF